MDGYSFLQRGDKGAGVDDVSTTLLTSGQGGSSAKYAYSDYNNSNNDHNNNSVNNNNNDNYCIDSNKNNSIYYAGGDDVRQDVMGSRCAYGVGCAKTFGSCSTQHLNVVDVDDNTDERKMGGGVGGGSGECIQNLLATVREQQETINDLRCVAGCLQLKPICMICTHV